MANRHTWRIVFTTIVACAALVVLGGVAFLYSGAYNVAASEPHTGVMRWALGTLQERSVAMRAAGVPSAPPIDSAMLQHGLEHYVAMCVMCHGAPGVDRGEVGQGLTPRPPNLARAATRLSERETYWILDHGIKLAGMPAFGETHSPEELWGLVGFMRLLPDMTPDEYRQMVQKAGLGVGVDGGADSTAGHAHAPGAGAHDH